MSVTSESQANTCPKHGILHDAEIAVLSTAGKRSSIAVSYCSICKCYYSRSELLPRDAKLSYKGYPLLTYQFDHAERANEIVHTKAVVVPSIPISAPAEQHVTPPVTNSEENNLPKIYLVDRKLHSCPLCQGNLTNTEKALRIKYSSKKKEGLFLQIQGKKCSKCHAMFVLAPVYERLSQGRSFFVKIIDLPVSEPSSNNTDKPPLLRRNNDNTNPAPVEAESFIEDWIVLPQEETAPETVRIRDVFTNPAYSNLITALEHDGYIFLPDLRGIKQLPGYVQRCGKMTWQGTLHAVRDIQRVQSLVTKTTLRPMIPNGELSKEEHPIKMESIEYNIVYDKQEFTADTLSSILIWICERMIERNPEEMLQLTQTPLLGVNSTIFFSNTPAENTPCRILSNDTWICVGYSEPTLLKMICAILAHFDGATQITRLWKTTYTSGDYELVRVDLDFPSQAYVDLDFTESKNQVFYLHSSSESEETQIDLQKELFEKWICEIKQLAPRTAKAYSGAIITCAEYARKAKLQYSSIYTITDASIFIQMQKRLVVYGPFVKLNRDGHNMYSAALSCYREFLQTCYKPNAEAMPIVKNPQQTHVVSLAKSGEKPGAEQAVHQPALQRLDFSADVSYRSTRPTSLSINGQEYVVGRWTEALVKTCEHMIAHYPQAMCSLVNRPLFADKMSIHISTYPLSGHACRRLSNGYWLDIEQNASTIVQMIKAICVHCGIQLQEVCIAYGKKNTETSAPPALRSKYKTALLPRSRQSSENAFSAKECITAVEEYLRGQGLAAVSVADIMVDAQLSQYTRVAIQNEINRSSNIVEIVNGRYIHRDSMLDFDSAANALLSILMQQFLQFDGYSNSHILYAAARIDLAMFLNDNDLDSEKSVYFLARHLFEKEHYKGAFFTFLDNLHIFKNKPDYPPSIYGLLIHQARICGGYISRTDCEQMLKRLELGSNNSINYILLQNNNDCFLQYSEGEYLLVEALSIDDVWFKRISTALDALFEEASYVIPRDIAEDWYLQLPVLPLGLRWTTLLLQELIQRYKQIPYIAIFAPLDRQAFDKIAAAIVPISDAPPTFADIVYDYISARLSLPQRMPAEELRSLLRNAGMLEGNELIYNMHKVLLDHRFAWSDENRTVYIGKR